MAMQQNLKTRLLDAISRVYELSENSKLDKSLFELLQEDLMFLSDYFKTNQNQSLLLAIVIALNYKGDTVDINDLIDYFEMNPVKILEFSDDLNFLFEQGYLKRKSSRHRVGVSLSNEQMTINSAITNAIINNEPLPQLKRELIDCPIELMEEIVTLIEELEESGSQPFLLFRRVDNLLNKNETNNYAKFIKAQSIQSESATILTSIIWEKMMRDSVSDVSSLLEPIFGKNSMMLRAAQQFYNKTHELLKKDLSVVDGDNFFNSADLVMTDKCDAELRKVGIIVAKKDEKSADNVIQHKTIIDKQLFYNEAEQKQLNTLHHMLIENNLQQTRQRLQQKGLPQGIVTLFYGPPGTGKTESVKQLAKATGRDIFKVEISETRSKWFGDSEKLVKKIFTGYKEFCKKSELLPILLFNEADAILSTRRQGGENSAVEQTLNTIQNILLEELENFEGIMVATTNLVSNMDAAFERRFLFKVKMDKPTPEIKAKIWLDKMEGLSHEQALVLSQQFDFSGGQIDNIVRKKEIEEIVHGKTVSFEEILTMCQQESWQQKDYKKVGFLN
jgi:AAA+ superfamily predicted ATPase